MDIRCQIRRSEFDGVYDHVTASSLDGASFPQDGTLSLWVKAALASQYLRTVFDGYSGARNHIFMRTCMTGDCAGVPGVGYQIAFKKTSGSYAYSKSAEVTNNVWNHLVVSWDTTNDLGYVYLNGSLVDSHAINDPAWIPDGQYVSFGANSDATNAFTGSLDDVRIYNRILSASEVQRLYGCTAPAHIEGAILYNSAFSTMQYCNGVDWVGIGK